jgi:hypothetical protein
MERMSFISLSFIKLGLIALIRSSFHERSGYSKPSLKIVNEARRSRTPLRTSRALLNLVKKGGYIARAFDWIEFHI